MAGEKFMLPYKVTDIQEMAVVRNMEYPRLAACIPKGIKFLVTKSDALYWDDCKECLQPIRSSTVFTELFFPISYLCDRYNCNISGIIAPKKMGEEYFLYKLTEKKEVGALTLDDVEIHLTDLDSKSNNNSIFSKRFELLQTIVSDIGDMNINTADFKEVKSFTELATLIKTELSKDRTSSIIVNSKSGIVYDNTSFYNTCSFSTYTSLFQIGCNIYFKGVLKNMVSKDFSTSINGLYPDEIMSVATFFTVDYKGTSVKLHLSNVQTNNNRASILTLRKLWLQNKSKFLDKEVTFTGFAFTPEDKEAPIGATFLKFNKI